MVDCLPPLCYQILRLKRAGPLLLHCHRPFLIFNSSSTNAENPSKGRRLFCSRAGERVSGSAPVAFYQWPMKRTKTFAQNLKAVEEHWREHVLAPPKIPEGATKRENKYVLAMFPYPSGRLHMGHFRVYSISDALARYYSLNGYAVLHPIGWDAFGLPAENAAIERGLDPKQWTHSNIEEMREQLKRAAFRFDWDRELMTCDPDYYRWTQWIFLRLHKHGLVRRTMAEVLWDPVDQTTLAAEQVDPETGRSWRSGAVAEKRMLRQWAIEIPRYAKRLLDGLRKLPVEWKEVAAIQANWIGKCDVYRFLLPISFDDSEFDGSNVLQATMEERLDLRIENPLDLAEAKCVLIRPEHSLATACKNEWENYEMKSTPFCVHNFVTNKKMPVFVDASKNPTTKEKFVMNCCLATTDDPILGNTMLFEFKSRRSKLKKSEVHKQQQILNAAKYGDYGGYLTSRRLRDWVVSRQRGWGTPIPMVLDGKSPNVEAMAVPEHSLPVTNDQRYTPATKEMFPSAPSRKMFFEGDTLDTFFDSSWYFLRYLDPGNRQSLSADEDRIRRWMPVNVYVGGVEHADLHLLYARFIGHFLHRIGVLPEPEPFRRLLTQGVVKAKTFRLEETGEYLTPGEVEKIIAEASGGGGKGGGERWIERATKRPVTAFDDKMSKSKRNGVDPMEEIERQGVDKTRLLMLGTASPRLPVVWGASQETGEIGFRRMLNNAAALVSAFGRKRLDAAEKSEEKEKLPTDHQMEIDCREAYNLHVREISIALEIMQNHCSALDKLSAFFRFFNKLDSDLFARSAQFERCLRAAVTMLQVFAPHTAAELWAGLSAESEKATTVFEQHWPRTDPDAQIEFVLSVFGISMRFQRAEVPRQAVEHLELDELLRLAKSEYHRRAFEVIAEKGLPVKGYSVSRWPGLQVSLNLEMGEGVGEAEISAVAAQISAEQFSAKMAEGGDGKRGRKRKTEKAAEEKETKNKVEPCLEETTKNKGVPKWLRIK